MGQRARLVVLSHLLCLHGGQHHGVMIDPFDEFNGTLHIVLDGAVELEQVAHKQICLQDVTSQTPMRWSQ